MIARNARRIATALAITASLATTAANSALAQNAPPNLASIQPNAGAFFTLNSGEDSGYATATLDASLLGDVGPAAIRLGDSTDLTGEFEAAVKGLPDGLSISLDDATVTWDASGRYASLTFHLGGTVLASGYRGTVTLTNTATRQQIVIPIAMNINPA
jgi:hypothetical protein